MKLKLLMVYLARYPTYPGFLSGGEQHFIQICKWALHHDIEVSVLTCPVGRDILNLYAQQVKTYTLSVPGEKFWGRWHNIGLSLVYFMRLIKTIPWFFFPPKGFHIVCSTSHYLPEVLPAALIARRNKGSKFITYIHHLEPPPWRAKGQPLLARTLSWLNSVFSLPLIRRYAQLVITVSLPVKRELVLKGISETRIKVFSNGIDLKAIDSAQAPEVKYEVCYFGRLAPSKGIFDIIDMWSQMRQHFPNVRIAIIGGDGEGFLAQVRARINTDNLENQVLLLGFVAEETKYSLLKSCLVFISPSYEEGWGIAICEALACGLPAVVYDLPAYQVFGDEALIKVPLGDKQAFLEAILKVLSDKSLREEMARKGKEVARQFSWEKVANEELTLFHQLVH